uniref:Uncharacterized protein n=1 Tax=Physcomitrium patens TaxID=3218 RepID=A0A7I3ZS41_PHYPA
SPRHHIFFELPLPRAHPLPRPILDRCCCCLGALAVFHSSDPNFPFSIKGTYHRCWGGPLARSLWRLECDVKSARGIWRTGYIARVASAD